MSKNTLNDLIEALQIFAKYGNPAYPTHCEHDILYICMEDLDKMTPEDEKKLNELSFSREWDDTGEGFASFRFGSS